MKQDFYDAISVNPVIAAIKNESGLLDVIKSDINVVFVLYGEISTIAEIVLKLKEAHKTVVVHMDLVQGLSGREESVNFIKKYTMADGIISTRIELCKHAKELNLSTIYRIFVIDSKALSNISPHLSDYTDCMEILPGLMPKIINKMVHEMTIPIIAGGLISDKEDVINALNAGAIAISTTNENVWKM